MKLNKFDEENHNISNNYQSNLAKDDSNLGLLKQLDSTSLFTKYPFNRKDIKKVSREKIHAKDNFPNSIAKSYKEDENISDLNHPISYDKHNSEEEFYNRTDKKEIFRRLMKKEKIVKFVIY